MFHFKNGTIGWSHCKPRRYLFNFPATYSTTCNLAGMYESQLPEEVFEMMNFVAAFILVDLSSKEQISLLPAILAPHGKYNPPYRTSDGHSRVEDICRFLLLFQVAPFEQELHLVASKLL